MDLYSPSITNSGFGQCHWRQMWNWGTSTVRKVNFIDFMCPIFSKKIAKKIKSFPNELFLGWGPDFYTGIIAEENNFEAACFISSDKSRAATTLYGSMKFIAGK